MNRLKLSFVVMVMLFMQSAFAANTTFFKKRFKLVREEGRLVEIRDNTLAFKFSIAPYVAFIKQAIKDGLKVE